MRIFALKKFVKNQLKYGVYIAPYEICPLAAGRGIFVLPVDRPTVKNLTVEPTSRPPGQPGLDPESNGSLVGRPPGRLRPDAESRALCRSIGAVDRGLF